MLSAQLRRKLCNALIQCHLDYCCTAWYTSLLVKDKCKLQVIQNKMVRFVLNLPSRSHIGQTELNAIDFLCVKDRVSQLRLNHVFKIANGQSPKYLNGHFTPTNVKHHIGTRSSSMNYYVPRVNGSTRASFYYNAILDWNLIPTSIKRSGSLQLFKAKVKKMLVLRSSERESCDFVY